MEPTHARHLHYPSLARRLHPPRQFSPAEVHSVPDRPRSVAADGASEV